MKKIFFALIIMIISLSSEAQTFRAGIAGGFNSTWLFNKNVSDAGDELDYKSSFGGQFGVSAVFIAENGPGISLDILSSSVNQKYTNKDTAGGSYETETSLQLISIPLLFRYTSEKGGYLEVGPEFSIISSGKVSLESSSFDIDKEYLNGMSIAAALGFGWDVKAGENFVISPGLRFAWGLSDVFSSKYKDDFGSGYEPTNSAVGGLHIAVTYILSGR